MSINGKTTVVGIFGDPVAHSLSPRMQNAAIAAGGLDAVYVPFHVTPGRLSDAVAGLRAMGVRGVNLTIPHKETACRLVDELDGQAALVGAINTIVNDGGRLKGYNTDCIGLLKALKEEHGVSVAGRRILLLGAGGAGRAALVALAQAGAAWIGVANRTRRRAEGLVDEMARLFPGTTFAHFEVSPTLTDKCPEPVDLLVNATAVGLRGESFGFDVVACVKPDGAVYDMIYSDEPTQLLRDARARGLATTDGLSMLAGQGEAAFHLWFGKPPQPLVMRRALAGER